MPLFTPLSMPLSTPPSTPLSGPLSMPLTTLCLRPWLHSVYAPDYTLSTPLTTLLTTPLTTLWTTHITTLRTTHLNTLLTTPLTTPWQQPCLRQLILRSGWLTSKNRDIFYFYLIVKLQFKNHYSNLVKVMDKRKYEIIKLTSQLIINTLLFLSYNKIV